MADKESANFMRAYIQAQQNEYLTTRGEFMLCVHMMRDALNWGDAHPSRRDENSETGKSIREFHLY